MDTLRITLFGKFSMNYNGHVLAGFDASKVEELLCYLLLNRDRPHSRELMASLLWGGQCTTAQSKKYLRNALWRLQATLADQHAFASDDFLCVEPDWIQLHSVAELWLDVADFEAAYASAKGTSGRDLDERAANTLERATALYRGDLLESWYQDWCLCLRERFLQMQLIMLDKLFDYNELHRRYETALSYGECVLRHDRARERTHRQMMRLYYLMGDRSGALRQYERCLAALRDELDIEPSHSTRALREQIRADRLQQPEPHSDGTSVREMIVHLQQLQIGLEDVQQQVQRAAKVTSKAMADWARRSAETGLTGRAEPAAIDPKSS